MIRFNITDGLIGLGVPEDLERGVSGYAALGFKPMFWRDWLAEE